MTDITQLFTLLADYGSILSSPSSEKHVKSSSDNATSTNQPNTKHEASETEKQALNMTENIAFSAGDSILDVDMHWEMNYRKAAIFLEVFIFTRSANDSDNDK